MNTSTVYIVDDDPALRKSMRWLVESVGLRATTFATAEEFEAAYQPGAPGCLVLDIRMPGMSGLDLQSKLCEHGITIPIIMVTGHGEVPTAVRAVKSGAIAFIEKPFSDQDLLDAVRQALEQDEANRETNANRREVEARYAALTPREREVMQLIVTGHANKQIACQLSISQKTVEVHRAHVMKKLRAQSVAELVRMAMCLEQATAAAPDQPARLG